jgi:hypothetical protein
MLVLAQGAGRLFQLAFHRKADSPDPELLPLSAADLESITFLERGDQLALWKYTQALRRAWERGPLYAPTALDQFAYYRMNHHSFFSSEMAMSFPPMIIGLRPGGAGDLRWKALQERDWHAAPSYIAGATTEVVSWQGTRDIPIYAERGSMCERLSLLVEGLPLPVWTIGESSANSSAVDTRQRRATGNAERDASSNRLRDTIATDVVDAVAYWIWQCAPSLQPFLASLETSADRILIHVRLQASDAWDGPVILATTDDHTPLRLRVARKSSTLQIMLFPAVLSLFATPDNAGERKLLLLLLQGLRSLLSRTERKAWPDSALADIVEGHAPLGLKKKLITLTEVPPDLDPRGLPTARIVQEADVEEVEDDLGAYLLTVPGLALGIVPTEHRGDVLKNAVGHLFDRFRHLVATLRSAELLELLITFNESLVRERAWNLLTIPTQLACFSSESEMVKHLQTRLPELATAGVANRFIIEYVAAQPPKGLRPISVEVYDHLMALAAQITGLGGQADLLLFGLTDVTLGLVPAGRLVVDRRQYSTAMDAYMSSLAAGEIARSTSAFGRRFGEPQQRASAISTDQFDKASEAEFGFSLTELFEFMAQARIHGNGLHLVTPTLPRDVFMETMTQTLGWPIGRVEAALDLLSLRPSTTFLPPPQPFTAADVYPWQYNRGLSLLRRPFIQCNRDGVRVIIWGPRQLDAAAWYLLELCQIGRLDAKSQEMLQLMSKLTAEQGRVFNDLVADRIQGHAHLVVRRRVKKIGRLKIMSEDTGNNDLGDLDVLVVNPRRHRVWLIDTKNLAGGRTPRELANELRKLFPQSDGTMRSFIEKHLRRAKWVRIHLDQMLQWLGVGTINGDQTHWDVQPLIVVDRELVTPFLQKPEIPIVAVEALDRLISDW